MLSMQTNSTNSWWLDSSELAFPGAEGYGKYSKGGKPDPGVQPKIIHVTNLESDGVGSLRYAIEQVGPRIILFRVGGVIKLEKNLVIGPDNGRVTIAGDSGPSPGITLRNATLFLDRTSDIIIRYLRCRLSAQYIHGPEDKPDSVTIAGSKHVILDHCSASWGVDECLSVSPKSGESGTRSEASTDVTIQWCIISEGLTEAGHPCGNHSMGSLLGNNESRGIARISSHHNLWAHNKGRNPWLQNLKLSDRVQVHHWNNVSYNFRNSGMAISGGTNDGNDAEVFAILESNYIKSGDDTGRHVGSNMGSVIKDDWGYGIWVTNKASYFISRGNIYERRYDGKVLREEDLDSGSGDRDRVIGFNLYPYNQEMRRRGNKYDWNMPYDSDNLDVAKILREIKRHHDESIIQSAEDAYQSVLNNAGAILPRRDSTDHRVVQDVRKGTGRHKPIEPKELESIKVTNNLVLQDAWKIDITKTLIFDINQFPHYSEILMIPPNGTYMVTIASADQSDSTFQGQRFEIKCTLNANNIVKKVIRVHPANGEDIRVGFVDPNNGLCINANEDKKVIYIEIPKKELNTNQWVINITGYQSKPESIRWLAPEV